MMFCLPRLRRLRTKRMGDWNDVGFGAAFKHGSRRSGGDNEVAMQNCRASKAILVME